MRKFILTLAAIAAFGVSSAFAAGQFSAYEKTKLDDLVKSGVPLVVHVHAEWCPVCRRQIIVLDKLFQDAKFAKFQGIRVNYDRDRDFIVAYKVKRQANILTFKDGKEVSRVDYDADDARIRAAVEQAL